MILTGDKFSMHGPLNGELITNMLKKGDKTVRLLQSRMEKRRRKIRMKREYNIMNSKALAIRKL